MRVLQLQENTEKIHALITKSLLNSYKPVIILGETSFSFHSYIQYANTNKIPLSLSCQLLVASAVNMHHVRGIIRYLQAEKNIFPILLDVSRIYLDESINIKIRSYLFRRDLRLLSKVSDSFVAIERPGRRLQAERKPFQEILSATCELVTQESEIIKNHSGRKVNGSSHTDIFNSIVTTKTRLANLPASLT